MAQIDDILQKGIKMKKCYVSYIVGLLLLIPINAFAHGDPIILYSAFGIGGMNFALGLYILLAKIFSGYRLPLIVVFFANTAITWSWALDYRGPNFYRMYVGLIGVPLLIFLCLYWLFQRLQNDKGENRGRGR